MENKSNNHENKNKNKILVFAGIIIVVLLLLFFVFKGTDNVNNSVENLNKTQDNQVVPGSTDNVNSDNFNTVSKNNVDGLKSMRFVTPEKVLLFEKKGFGAGVVYDSNSDFTDSVKVTIEKVEGTFKKSFILGYSRTGSEVYNMINLELNKKEDIEKIHKYIIYMEYKGKIILEKKFEVEVIPKYAFAENLTASVKYDYLTLKIFPLDDSLKLKINIKNNGVTIIERFVSRVNFKGLSQTTLKELLEYDEMNNKWIQKKLSNPTIDIYDNERGLYIVKDLSVEVQ